MRINLVTPFADKDQAKALGARWDPVKKNWYIVDVADLTPFALWIPNAAGAVAAVRTLAPSQPRQVVPHCGCAVLPWDDCTHTTFSGA
jgi:hypothetical protein